VSLIGTVAAFKRIREQPTLSLLNATNFAEVAGLLAATLGEGSQSMPYPTFVERVTRGMEELRAANFELSRSPDQYIAEWIRRQWIAVHFPEGANGEQVSLTLEAVLALRFMRSLLKPRVYATESRLQTVLKLMSALAKDTDPNPESRLESLLQQRAQLDAEIDAVRAGRVDTITNDQARERTREILMMAEELVGDFHRVRDEFAQLNQHTREEILNEEDGHRGRALQDIMDGVDRINESDAGKTFTAFFGLFSDHEQSSALNAAIDAISARGFMKAFNVDERNFLLQLPRKLLDESRSVQEMRNQFAKSLRTFVQSREYLEHRRLSRLLKEAMRAGLEARDAINPSRIIKDFEMTRSTTSIDSIGRNFLLDPAARLTMEALAIVEQPESEISLDEVSRQIQFADIDFRSLRLGIRTVLQNREQASISDVLQAFPARQGLASVVGLMDLANRHGTALTTQEVVTWRRADGVHCAARIPTMVFTKDKAHVFAD
jgi:hypothetical protein